MPVISGRQKSILISLSGAGTENWTVDNYGPMWIPKKGATIPLTPDNVIRYKRCIAVYEANKFEEKNGQYFINDQRRNHLYI